MFGSALETIQTKVRSTRIDPITTEMCGIPIKYENYEHERDTWEEWESILEEWLPRFDGAGYLDGLQGIYIGEGYMKIPSSEGQYSHEDETISFQQDPSFSGQPWLVGTTKEYALIHEMVHHAHIRELFEQSTTEISVEDLNERQRRLNFNQKMWSFDEHVSKYAAGNYLEAVAETCAGVVLGEVYPVEIQQNYEELGGPEPIGGWNHENHIEKAVTRQDMRGQWKAETITIKSNADE